MTERRTFSTKNEAYAIESPTDKPFVEVWHATVKGFGIRAMRASARNGQERKVYLARYTDRDGKDVKKVLGELGELDYRTAQRTAEDLRDVVRHEKTTGRRPLPRLQDALDEYITPRESRLADTTIADYRRRWNYLKPWFDKNVLEISSEDWKDKYVELMKTGKPTADGVLRIAHAVYQSLVDDERLDRNPVKRVAALHEIFARGTPKSDMVTKAELPLMWRWLEANAHVNTRDWIRIALFCGLRDSVIGNLRWENVNVKERLMAVPAEEKGNKSKRLVWVPFSDWIFDNVIYPRHLARNKDNPWVIPSHKKAGQALHKIGGTCERMREEIGIYIHPHKLRHTFGTIAKKATGDQLITSRMLTHTHSAGGDDSAPAVTAGYITTDDDEKREAFNKTAALILQYVSANSES